MRIFHYLEIENFKGFGERQRIELDHPTVLIGPNNSGKTTAIQAIALWSQAVKTWYDAAARAATVQLALAVPLNRLAIAAVPVARTRQLWHNARTRDGEAPVYLGIAVGVQWQGEIRRFGMRFHHLDNELAHCQPEADDVRDPGFVAHVAGLGVHLLYSMSGLAAEEPLLHPGRIDVLLGEGQTAQVLRNLCLSVWLSDRDHGRWHRIAALMHRLFGVRLSEPTLNARGAIDLGYREGDVDDVLELTGAGRGFQQMLLILAYLFSHEGGVLLIDEPDAHFELLRQKQIYVLLRDLAHATGSQVVMATHSDVVLDEALDRNLTLIVDGVVDDVARKVDIKNSLKHFGTAAYVKARLRGHVLYVEGGTDLDLLRALAERLHHPVLAVWDERANVSYVQNNYPLATEDSELERVEGGCGVLPRDHFFGLRSLLPDLRGLAILDNDGKDRRDADAGGLRTVYWRRYEAENYLVTPAVLLAYIDRHTSGRAREQGELFAPDPAPDLGGPARALLDELTRERVFQGNQRNFEAYRQATGDTARALWELAAARVKLSDFAEELFRRLAAATGAPMLLRKGELHQLAAEIDPATLDPEVGEKLDLLLALWRPTD